MIRKKKKKKMKKDQPVINQKSKSRGNTPPKNEIIPKEEEKLDNNDEVSSSSNNSDLFDRLLKDKRFINYKELILDIKDKKEESLKPKRFYLDDDDDDLDFDILNKLLFKKKKIRYPKK